MKYWLASINFALGFFFVIGCSLFDGNSKEAKTAKILHSPPFESITDSIGQFPKNAHLYIQRAELLSQKDLPDLASYDYQKAWHLQPDETTALSYTASLFMTGKETQAITLLQECIKKYPQNIEFPRRLSEVYVQNGKNRAALDLFDKLVAADSNNFEALYQKGTLLAALKDTIHAIQSLERAYFLQPLQLVGVSLANLYAETKNKRALELCDQLISSDSSKELTDAIFIKGIYFANTHQQDEALLQFEDCINHDWKFTEAYIEKGIILFNEHNIDEALQTFTLAARVSTTDPDAYYWMGRCYENIGKKDEARNNYVRALSLDKNFKESKESLKRLNND
jgi:tetratricopeptide (TPR) repeat protein